MTSMRVMMCLLLSGLILSCGPASQRVMTPEEREAVAETVAQLFDEITVATNALDFDRLLSYYRESEDLTYVARGRVTRSHASFADLVDAQFGGVVWADLRWLDTYVDVLSREVGIATATYEFRATLEGGDTVQSRGTFVAVFVHRDGRWQIEHSAHSFPPGTA